MQRLMAEIQQEARQGDLRLVKFIERRVREQFELAAASADAWIRPSRYCGLAFMARRTIGRDVGVGCRDNTSVFRRNMDCGILRAEPHGAAISGETRAALEFLCEQLPGALDLCRLIEEKLQLERELAERERLAVLGQMAASISHNLKNPLGSIKTILQVQLESAELPESIRGETKMVLEEIGRLSSKLNQLLQFSRPAIRGGVVVASCDAQAVAEEVSGVLRHEAERRGVAFEMEVFAGATKLAASCGGGERDSVESRGECIGGDGPRRSREGERLCERGWVFVCGGRRRARGSGKRAREDFAAIFYDEDAGDGAWFGDCGEARCGVWWEAGVGKSGAGRARDAVSGDFANVGARGLRS